ncbi:MAG: hypothetical protein U1A72_18135 [Sulfuritalea sp.]|nr:hypothetical protein [Sulfuritalea sp.]
MNPIDRILHTAIALVLIATSVATASADEDGVARQAEYRRFHDSAVAFAKTVRVSADRYPGLRSVDMGQVQGLIALSEQAAQKQQFGAASTYARKAYELLRSAIVGAVARSKQGGN